MSEIINLSKNDIKKMKKLYQIGVDNPRVVIKIKETV